MRVLILSLFPFGVSPRVTNLAIEISKKHDVYFILPKGNDNISDGVIKMPHLHIIHPLKLPFKSFELSMPLYIPHLIKKVNDIDFDIIHTFKVGPFSTLPGYLLKKIKKKPFIIDNDDWDSEVMKEQGHPWHRYTIVRWVEDNFPQKADGLTVGSRYLYKKMSNMGILDNKINYIPNGVDPQKFNPKLKINENIRKKYCIKNEILAIFVGKLNKFNHIAPMIDAFSILKKKNIKNIKCLIVGGGDKLEELKLTVSEKGLSEYFIFTGFIKNVPEYLAQSDIALATFADVPSLKAASNLKVFEYMAMKLPTIVTDIGDLPEYVDFGKAGIIAKPNSIDIAEKIIFLSENIDVRKKLGENARKRILKYYTWKIQANKVDNVYNKLLRRE